MKSSLNAASSPAILALCGSLVLAGLTAQAADLSLGHEQVPAGEAEAIEKVITGLLGSLKEKQAKNPSETVQRDAHPKAHGCVKATFTVKPGLSPQVAQGLFADAKTYSAWIRFSNGSPGNKPDTSPDARGMAIKVMGVPGDKILADDEKLTQDFLLMNSEVFFVRNALDYVGFQRNLPLFLATHALHEGRILAQIMLKSVANPFLSQYWSATPSRLGADAGSAPIAVKYTVIPIACGNSALLGTAPGKSPNFLRDAMIETLKNGDTCFAMQVQVQRDAKTMPIEDPTESWEKAGARSETVATIRIPRDGNDGKLGTQNRERTQFCENIALTPWHSLPAHRPLGGINRVRKTVYQTISKFRRDANGVFPFEPTGNENF